MMTDDDNPYAPAAAMVSMRHPETGGVAQFPPASVASWEARGWVRDDPDGTPATTPGPDPQQVPAKRTKPTSEQKEVNDGA